MTTNNIPTGPRTNHILHLLLTVFTGGFWIPVWLIVHIVNILDYNATMKRLKEERMQKEEVSLYE